MPLLSLCTNQLTSGVKLLPKPGNHTFSSRIATRQTARDQWDILRPDMSLSTATSRRDNVFSKCHELPSGIQDFHFFFFFHMNFSNIIKKWKTKFRHCLIIACEISLKKIGLKHPAVFSTPYLLHSWSWNVTVGVIVIVDSATVLQQPL